ncbi:MAG TPA: tetratricopeptide repeat protein [Gemmatimonadaceae bacterium]
MRADLVLSTLLSVAALGVARAQCSPAIQKLSTDQRYDEARAEAEALANKNSLNDAALHCVGWVLMNAGKSKDAIEWFEKAIKVDDKVSAHHLWLANALGEQADHTSKIKLPFLARRIKSEFEKASQLDPTSIEARHGLIQFYSQAPGVMGGDMDKAKEQANEIAKLNAMRGHLEMGALLEREKDVAGAEREYTAALTIAPDSNIAYSRLASFFGRQKKFAEAVATYERLLKVKPDAINARLNIAWNLVQSGKDVDRAEREAKAWLADQPKDAAPPTVSFAHYALGRIYEQQAKKDAARGEYRVALTVNPKNEDAKKALANLK